MNNQPKNIRYFSACQGYLNALREKIVEPYPESIELINHPELLDELLSVQKTEDLCYAFFVDHTAIDLPLTIDSFDPNKQDEIFKNIPPFIVCDYFQKDDIVECYTKQTEFKENDQFKNHPTFQQDIHQILNT